MDREVLDRPLEGEHGRPKRRGPIGRVRGFVGRHRALATVAAVLVVGFVVFVVVWFEPHKLFIDQRVDEPLPVATGSPVATVSPVLPTGESPGGQPTSPAPAASGERPDVLAEGGFQSLEHSTTGTARVLRLADGRLILRFENLDTSNGPDLRVYLSEIPAGPDWHAYGERFIDLGELSGNLGNQNYEIPSGTDLSRFRSAVIWCRRFTVGFGVAPLEGLASTGG